MDDTQQDYSAPVHHSLEHPIPMFGIGTQAFLIIVMTTTVLSTLVSVWCIGVGVIGLLVVKKLCKKEPLLVDFIVQNLLQEKVYRG